MSHLPIAKEFSELLQDSTSLLGFYQRKVSHLLALNQLWQKHMHADLVKYSRIANFRDDCLVIEVANAAWASKLRYCIPDLLQQLKSWPELSTLKHIDWYLRVKHYDSLGPAVPPTQPRSLSAQTCSLLKSVANTLRPDLQQALRRLAKSESDYSA